MKTLVFTTEDYKYLAEQIAQLSGYVMGSIEKKKFPDGERYLRIQESVRGTDVVLVGGTISEESTLDIFDLACGLVSDGCQSLTILVPFFGYSTMERAVRPGEVVTAKTRARLLSAIPLAPFGNRVVLLDLHSEGIPFYFEGGVRAHHIYAKSLIIEQAKIIGGKNFVLGCVDAGRAKWVESLANDMKVAAGFVYKRRATDGSTKVSGTNIDVKGLPVIIYDDMIRSGGSVLGAAKAYKEAGASSVTVIATHGLFSSDGLIRLKDSGIISQILCTDSHPQALRYSGDSFLKIIPTASLFVGFLKGQTK